MTRRGLTLIELLVVMAIIGLLFALLAHAISAIRVSAFLVASKNNLRQITLASLQFADQHKGRLGGAYKPDPKDPEEFMANAKLGLCDYDIPPQLAAILVIDSVRVGTLPTGRRAYLLSPMDPSVSANEHLMGNTEGHGGPCSYAFNMTALTGPPRVPLDIRDGSSNTIFFAESRFIRQVMPGPPPEFVEAVSASILCYGNPNPAYPLPGYSHRSVLGLRRPSFADLGWQDVVPITVGGITRPSVSGVTFQVQPSADAALIDRLCTPFAAGLPVSMFDGSVRMIHRSVSPEAFWSAVTANGNEASSLD